MPLQSPDDIRRRVLNQYLNAEDSVIGLQPASGGFSEAAVLKVITISGRYALRSWPAGSWPHERILERRRWLQHLESHGCRVAVPRLTRDGAQVIVSTQQRDWQLEPWLPGVAVSASEMTPARWTNLMSSLAKLHDVSQCYVTTAAGADWFRAGHGGSPSIGERRRLIASWSPARVVETRATLQAAPEGFRELAMQVLNSLLRSAEQIDHELRSLEFEVVPLFPCLRDLWSDHVLFENDEVSGLIDPTATRTDHVATDLSRLLGSFLFDDFQSWSAAIADYEAVRPLAPVEHRLIRVLDRSSVLLSGLTWIGRWQRGEIRDPQFTAVLNRMRSIAARTRNL